MSTALASFEELKARALRLLASREHSRVELRSKLGGGQEDEQTVEAVLDRLLELGLQSDERYAQAYVRSKGLRFGATRLRHELAQRGIAREIVDATLEQLSGDDGIGDEIERAREVWSRKFGTQPQDAKEWARQARFLQARGFSPGVIRQVLKESSDEFAAGQ